MKVLKSVRSFGHVVAESSLARVLVAAGSVVAMALASGAGTQWL